MNILLVSQCSKNALNTTQRIIDQFAERVGERTWLTMITQEGLNTLSGLLRKTARRNTAIACHWLKSPGHIELLWIIGSVSAFSENGTVPTNVTSSDILKSSSENGWHTGEPIALLCAMAGLFHDFGKASKLFQTKLKRNASEADPFRHEWVSLRLFELFVSGRKDEEWLKDLLHIGKDKVRLKALDDRVAELREDCTHKRYQPFFSKGGLLHPLSRAIGWLLITHHLLPTFPKESAPQLHDGMSEWLYDKDFGYRWNADREVILDKRSEGVWKFPHGLPWRSLTWQERAQSIARRTINCIQLTSKDWMTDRFSLHLARLCLMLGDHSYSSGDVVAKWQDKSYKPFANTRRSTGELKQKLDEHNIGVSTSAYRLARELPRLRSLLPGLGYHKAFRARARDERFRWQDQAFDLARALASRTEGQGFFGVNMASTGAGKTFANARIMYGLSDERTGCRFSVALGLRTLTLQTGTALRNRLKLGEDEVGVLLGSNAVEKLHGLTGENNSDMIENRIDFAGSESVEPLLPEHLHLRYEGMNYDGWLGKLLSHDLKIKKLLNAPVLVCTIDQLIGATEGIRGGQQIAPMLRLLTSDLVLDEPDEFDNKDLPALARLVNWTGLMGGRILLSSATLPPALISGLFEAYESGRKYFRAACRPAETSEKIVCAWFDESGKPTHEEVSGMEQFSSMHLSFVEKRVNFIQSLPAKRLGRLKEITIASREKEEVLSALADDIGKEIFNQHSLHAVSHEKTGKRLSVGVIRCANINPMVEIAQHFLRKDLPEDFALRFCVYHSRYPLVSRSLLEGELDKLLQRGNQQEIWQYPVVSHFLSEQKEKNLIIVVFATPVEEVGRDHDYDWVIIEPSSLRSITQMAGRAVRHRNIIPNSPNVVILSQNVKALTGDKKPYRTPGYESERCSLRSHNLNEVLDPEQYRIITSIPRILPRHPLRPAENLADLEHKSVELALEDASLWWKEEAHWYGVAQRAQPFRASQPEERFAYVMTEEDETGCWKQFGRDGMRPAGNRFEEVFPELGDRIQPLLTFETFEEQIAGLAERLSENIEQVSMRFAELRLPDDSKQGVWSYSPHLGFFR